MTRAPLHRSQGNERSFYEARGWADGRLGQAYDLIAAVKGGHHTEHEIHRMLTSLLGAVEQADIEIGVG